MLREEHSAVGGGGGMVVRTGVVRPELSESRLLAATGHATPVRNLRRILYSVTLVVWHKVLLT